MRWKWRWNWWVGGWDDRDIIALRHDQWKLSHARPGDVVPLCEETMKTLHLGNTLLEALGDPPLQGLTPGVFQPGGTLFNQAQTYCPQCGRHR